MKLCYLSSSTIPSVTANSIHVMKMCDAFAELGHSITLFAKRSPLKEEPYYFYDVQPRFQLRYRPKARNILEAVFVKWSVWQWILKGQVYALQPDLIYGRNAKALQAVQVLGIPFVLEAHMLPRKPNLQEHLFSVPNFRRLVVISEALKTDYLSMFPSLQKTKVLVAPDGASPPKQALIQPVRSSGRLQVGYIGHLYPGKGIEIILQLPSSCPWADFHVVGGTEKDLAYWRSKLINIPNLTLHGFIPHRETGAYLAAFDVVLAPYQTAVSGHGGGPQIGRWMSPLKIFEYMSHGKAIVASDLPVLREVLENEHNALLVLPEDPEAWIGSIKRLRSDRALRDRLGQTALQDFQTRYSWHSRAEAVLEGLELS